jgi:hypothetical protein
MVCAMGRLYDQVWISFPGIASTIGGCYTLAHGIQAGMISITCHPQNVDLISNVGTVRMEWRSTVIELPNCRAFSHSLEASGDGFILRVMLEDRRWKWRWPTISGRYNLRTGDATIYGPTKKNPQQLAMLLLDAMDEPRVDVSDLPTDDYPFVEWYGSTAAEELSSLCDRYGCHIVMQIDGSVVLRKIGVGTPLPMNLPIASDSESLPLPITPDALEVHFGPTKYRANILLEPVGIDVDGTVKPVNQLSYKPAGGWEQGDLPGAFSRLNVSLKGNPKYDQKKFILDLARKSIYKWYRITAFQPDPNSSPLGPMPYGSPLNIPGYGKIDNIDQLLPIDDKLSNVTLDPNFKLSEERKGTAGDQDNTKQFYEVYDNTFVWGTFYKNDGSFFGGHRHTDGDAFSKAPSINSYRAGGYSIDRERGIVMFDDYVWRLSVLKPNPGGHFEFPQLAISVMVSPRDRKTFEMKKHVVRRDYGGQKNGTQARVILHPEFQKVVVHDIDQAGRPGPARETNKGMLEKVARYYLDATERQYQRPNPQTLTYNGLWIINPNGAIQQVTFNISGESGVDTIASFNDETRPYLLPYERRRENERTRAGIDKFGLTPPVFYIPSQNFPYNMGSAFISAVPSRR